MIGGSLGGKPFYVDTACLYLVGTGVLDGPLAGANENLGLLSPVIIQRMSLVTDRRGRRSLQGGGHRLKSVLF